MTVFVLGGAGAIGRLLVPLLREVGHRVAATTRSRARVHRLVELGAEPAVVDALDPGALADAVRRARPEVVVCEVTSLGGDFSRLDELVAENARVRLAATVNAVSAAAAAGARRVVAQGVAFSYAPGEGPADEDEPFRDEDGARAALAGDEAVLGSPLEGLVARYGYLYGPGTWYSREGAAAEALRAGTLRASARGEESLVHVDDAARATAALVEDGRPGAYNVVDDEPASRAEWLSALAAAVGAPPPAEADPSAPPRRGASNRRVAEEIGWRPRFASWREGFRRGLP